LAIVVLPFVVTVVVAFSLGDFVTTVFVEAVVGAEAAIAGIAISARAVSEPISAFILSSSIPAHPRRVRKNGTSEASLQSYRGFTRM
jgi:hypothetical protein